VYILLRPEIIKFPTREIILLKTNGASSIYSTTKALCTHPTSSTSRAHSPRATHLPRSKQPTKCSHSPGTQPRGLPRPKQTGLTTPEAQRRMGFGSYAGLSHPIQGTAKSPVSNPATNVSLFLEVCSQNTPSSCYCPTIQGRAQRLLKPPIPVKIVLVIAHRPLALLVNAFIHGPPSEGLRASLTLLSTSLSPRAFVQIS